jgi:hypothetical protein
MMKFHYTTPTGNDFQVELTTEELVAALTAILPLLRAQADDREGQLQRLMETLTRVPLAQVS